MAVVPQLASYEIVELRELRSRDLVPLLAEEEREWREELRWDYRPSAEVIRKYLDARTLPGLALRLEGRVAGYCFYVYEEEKALLGDLYIGRAYRRTRLAGGRRLTTLLLEHVLEKLLASPARRIEAQLVSFTAERLAPVFQARRFQVFPRLFMYRDLSARDRWIGVESAVGGALRPWEDDYFEPMAELIAAAYQGHVDSHINDHYTTTAGALRFLKNIVLLPGCGAFQRETSLVAVDPAGAGGALRLAGAVLTSQVAPGVAHVTQICVRPEHKGKGLGRRLMHDVLARLVLRRYAGVSLTVTAANKEAVGLYRRLGFRVIKEFAAYSRALR